MLVGLVVHQGENKYVQNYCVEEDEDSHESVKEKRKVSKISMPTTQQACNVEFTYE